MPANDEVQIRAVPPEESAAALWLLFGSESPAIRRERVLATARAAAGNRGWFEHLLEARRGATRVGAVWGQLLPGKNANIWPPSLAPGEPPTTAWLLQETLDQRLQRAGLVIAQALLSITAGESAECLSHCGYTRAARLLYLICDREQFAGPPTEPGLAFVPYTEAEADRMASLIEETYVDTKDVPLLDGIRAVGDVLAGYRATGEFAPERWFFVRHAERDVGCLLLTDHPQLGNWELVYMGLVPAARGQGWGTQLVRYAQSQTFQAGRASLLVSVDASNEPAVLAYSRCGFTVLDRRDVWIKRFPSA